MDPKATENLRLDRRLHQRRDWISPAELEKEIAALPDASDKIDRSQEDEDSGTEAGGSEV